MENNTYPFVNLPLPYAFDALEPYIDQKTMELHHDRHLQAYIDHLNATLQTEPLLQKLPLEKLIQVSGRLPGRLRDAVRNNAGGVYNHRFFFAGMSPGAKTEPEGILRTMLERQYGGVEGFRERFREAALSVFGSGYAWLVQDGCRLHILTSANQDSPVERRMRPLLAVDVWEHAYYLKHYNLRAAYLDDWFQVINWRQAEQNLLHGGSRF